MLLVSAMGARPAMANDVTSGYTFIGCTGGSVTIGASNLDPAKQYYFLPTIDVSCVDPATGATTTAAVWNPTPAPLSTGSNTGTGTTGFAWRFGQSGNTLSGVCAVETATASLTSNPAQVFPLTMYQPITGTLVCGPAPPACTATTSVSSNFNGTAIPGSDYIWFNAHFKASGIPKTGAVVTFTNSTITLNGQTLPVPNATITFSPSVTCLSTTFDPNAGPHGTFFTTSPLGGSDEIFLTGLAYKVPSTFTSKNQPAPAWSGQFSSNAPGVSMQWQWGAAVYSQFSTDYNAVNPLAGHGNACVAGGGDHAGTPESLYKSYVVGGATGGGGSNWTGSWSGTSSVTPACH